MVAEDRLARRVLVRMTPVAPASGIRYIHSAAYGVRPIKQKSRVVIVDDNLVLWTEIVRW